MEIIERPDFDALFGALADRGYEILGPTVRDEAIVLDRIERAADLPVGWTDEQREGRYRLVRRDDEALFGYVAGPQSFKQFLFPAEARLWRIRRRGPGFEAEGPPEDGARPMAFLGVRGCDLAAIEVQDRVFLGGEVSDPIYARRRAGTLIVGVDCVEAGGTCFCVSMDTGPRVGGGADLVLTELIEGGHRFLARAASERGAEILAAVPHRPASAADLDAAERGVKNAAAHMGRHLDTADLPARLVADLEHPRWDQVARRCLSCANCTLVCPTCFCSDVEDTADLSGDHAERWRRWDSCFTMEHSKLHGAPVRATTRSRYRQWLTHKLSTWWDQFGTSGCVGCGRCITWCPVGIDITEEAAAIAGDGGTR